MFFRRPDREIADKSEPVEPGALDRVRGGRRTVIGARTRVQGALRGHGPVLVCGGFRGEMTIEGALAVAPGANLEADIAVESAHIAGRVRGTMRASTSVRLEPDGTVEGDLSTPVIDFRPGAILRGRASVVGPARRPGH